MGTFNCTMCGACCTNFSSEQSVLMLRHDVEKIARAKGMSVDSAEHEFCEINDLLSERANKVIYQLRSNGGQCIFLEDMKKCTVHDYKPTQCRIGPDRFLPEAMKQDYECMTGFDLSDSVDLTSYFFSQLLED